MRRLLGLSLAVMALFLVACGDDGDDNPNNGFAPCSDANKCPDGQFCFNGLCAIGCLANSDCAADQYCDTEWSKTCQNKEVPSCTKDDDCGSEQVCKNGLCSAAPVVKPCNPENLMSSGDGCNNDAICFAEEDETTSCYAFPLCAEDDTCPVGAYGATCNTGYIPSKGRICMTGICAAAANCPSAQKCVKATEAEALGFCSSGAMGTPCSTSADCTSGLDCQSAGAGTIGFCMQGGMGGCTSDTDCEDGETCDTMFGMCVPAMP